MATPAERWSALHHGIDPGGVRLLRGWLRLMWALARPLHRLRVPPTAVTVLGGVLAIDAVLLARGTPWVALVAVLVAALCDGVDGALAVVSGRVTVAGARADMVVDRLSDCAFAAVLWRCGEPWWLAALAGALSLVHEGFRTWRAGALRARVTVAERPTRVICTALACGVAGVSSAAWPPTVCAAVWAGLALVGLAQLTR